VRRRKNAIQIKTRAQLQSMRAAGLVVADALAAMRAACTAGTTTQQLDQIARDVLRRAGATSNFLNYDIGSGPYPGVICASVNDWVVHGIPSNQVVLAEGDLISIDFGAVMDGWHGDAAITVAVGAVDDRSQALSNACEAAMWAGLATVAAGARLGDVSHAIETSVRNSGTGTQPWGIVDGYGGHGIGTSMHMAPHILNYGPANVGPVLEAGMALAIEPMLTAGRPGTKELDDGWTVVTADGSRAAHWEHTIAIYDDGPFVLTAHDGGRAGLAACGVQLSAAAS
jgi:methionyl aminopeptidase